MCLHGSTWYRARKLGETKTKVNLGAQEPYGEVAYQLCSQVLCMCFMYNAQRLADLWGICEIARQSSHVQISQG